MDRSIRSHERGRISMTRAESRRLAYSARVVQNVARAPKATSDQRDIADSLVRLELRRLEIESKRYWAKSP